MDIKTGNLKRQTTYQIKVQGWLRENWAGWLNGTVVAFRREGACTCITVAVPDQAALRGILNKLWDLNLKINSVSLKGE